jgi:serine protease Do
MFKLLVSITASVVLLTYCCPTPVEAQYARRTAIVEAVNKTRDGVLTIRAYRGSRSREVIGTGVVVDERGYAITNNHVVANATSIQVTLANGTTVEASLFAAIPESDLAILKLPADCKVKALVFGPGSDLMVGETVIAIGNPYGFANSVTTGIISALNREIPLPGGAKIDNVIQHSALINSGNSGGPLLNINGDIIGINVALHQGAQGICFALNAETVKGVLARHLSASRIARVKHGLSCIDKPGDEVGGIRQHVVVDRVIATGPAESAGIRKGDVIVEVGGQSLKNRFDLERALWSRKAGETVEVRIVREGKETSVLLHLNPTQPPATTLTSGYGNR